MTESNSSFLSEIISLGDNERVRIGEDIVAPAGLPVVDISGDNAQLRVLSNGSLSAPDAGNSAVLASGSNVNISNRGSLSGALNGISTTGDNFRLTNRGTIASDSRAVDLTDGDNLSVTNRGSILGTGNQRNGTLYVDGTVDNANILNARGAVIDAGADNLGDALSWQVGAAGDASTSNINIDNRGLLQGRGDGDAVFAGGARVGGNGSSGLRFFNGSEELEAALSGTIRNSGTITSEVNVGFLGGLVVEDGVAFSGNITNTRSGLISGPRNGLYIGNAEHNLTIDNSGRIESGSRAVNIDGSGVRLQNSGEIIGTGNQRNGTIYSDATAEDFSIQNDRRGVVDAGSGNQGAGISLQLGDEAGDVIESSVLNRGVIQGRGDAADGTNAAGDGIRLFAGIADGDVTFQGDITNGRSGRIIGSQDGITVQDRVTLQGNIINERRSEIVGEQDGISIEGVLNGDINNSGTIRGGVNAIDAQDADAGVTINNAGNLEGNVTLSEFNDVFTASGRSSIEGVVSGLGGDDVIFGDRADNLLDGGAGDDTLSGGRGQDRFIFSAADFGADTITDFRNGQDLIDVSALNLGAGGIEDAIEGAQQVGGDTQITLAQGSITLQGFNLGNLDSADFVA
ncbi:MAG: hypothetical protein AB8B99_07435 [Phormidesmis sp.]